MGVAHVNVDTVIDDGYYERTDKIFVGSMNDTNTGTFQDSAMSPTQSPKLTPTQRIRTLIHANTEVVQPSVSSLSVH